MVDVTSQVSVPTAAAAKPPVRRYYVLGLLTGFAGVVVLMSRDLAHASTSSLLGQAAVILASVFYAISSVIARKAIAIPGQKANMR